MYLPYTLLLTIDGLIFRDGSFGRGPSRVTVGYISCYSYDATYTLDDCYINKELCYYTYTYNHYGLRCYGNWQYNCV